jgi:hypothetical protein
MIAIAAMMPRPRARLSPMDWITIAAMIEINTMA